MKFRKKPVVIEAILYTEDSRDAVIAWGYPHIQSQSIDDDGAEYELMNLRIPTLEGTMILRPGNWLIRGVNGELYPCKPDIFDATYERVSDEA